MERQAQPVNGRLRITRIGRPLADIRSAKILPASRDVDTLGHFQ